MSKKSKVVVLIPIYKKSFAPLEQFSIDYSLFILGGRTCVFIAPQDLDVAYYTSRYPKACVERFPAECFVSVDSYSRLLLGADFYRRFLGAEFMLMLQPDAILIADHLDYWMKQPFDYIGAPWPDGIELNITLDRFGNGLSRRARATVGNGGLSLRRIKKCISLIDEFPETNQIFAHTGTNEDAFFSLLGGLSNDFVIPNEITASRFSMELKPDYYHKVNGGHYPMGVHAWGVVNPTFWAPCIPPLAKVL